VVFELGAASEVPLEPLVVLEAAVAEAAVDVDAAEMDPSRQRPLDDSEVVVVRPAYSLTVLQVSE
jgi:hypothetical protein